MIRQDIKDSQWHIESRILVLNLCIFGIQVFYCGLYKPFNILSTNLQFYENITLYDTVFKVMIMPIKVIGRQQCKSMDNNKNGQSYAPFGSVSPRAKQKRKKLRMTDPGPGSYNISLPIIEPIVQTIKKKNNNVIVKLGHIGTASFQGNQDRFKVSFDGNQVGPGQYLHQKSAEEARKKRERPMRIYANQMLNSIIDKTAKIDRTPTIPNLKTLQLEQYMEMPKANISQQQGKQLKSQQRIRGAAWSRMKEQRSFESISKRGYALGPGSYQAQSPKKKSNSSVIPSSAFISQSVRSFFDQIYFDTNHMIKAKQRQQRNYKGDSIGPGSYQIQTKNKNKQAKFQFFGSTSERM